MVELLKKRRAEDPSVAVTCVFCDYNDRENQTAINLLSSLAQQMLQQIKTLPEDVRSIYKDHKRKNTRLGLDDCIRILRSAINPFSKIFIVIDALDECSRDAAPKFIESVLQLADARILITSRPDTPNFPRHFRSFPSLKVCASRHDVRRYLEARIEEEHELAELVDEYPGLHGRIVTTIEQKSGGM